VFVVSFVVTLTGLKSEHILVVICSGKIMVVKRKPLLAWTGRKMKKELLVCTVRNMIIVKRVKHFSAEWLKNHRVLKVKPRGAKKKFISV